QDLRRVRHRGGRRARDGRGFDRLAGRVGGRAVVRYGAPRRGPARRQAGDGRSSICCLTSALGAPKTTTPRHATQRAAWEARKDSLIRPSRKIEFEVQEGL